MPLTIGNSFLGSYKITIPVGGNVVIKDITGAFFLCKSSDYEFEMSIDGSSWFTMDAGFDFPLPDGFFEKLYFRNLSGADAAPDDNEVKFYAGSINLRDSRFTIIRDQTIGANIPVVNAQTTGLGSGEVVLGAGLSTNYPGTVGGKLRKQFVVFNADAANELQVTDTAGNVMGVLAAKQSWTVETSADLKVKNPTGGDLTYVVGQIFYR